MLAKFFTGPCELPPPSAVFSEPISTIQEMKAAIQRLKNGKGGDEVGLTAELLKHVPHEFLDALLRLYNDVLYTGEPPASWSKSLFTMLPKKLRAKQVADFRPIANLRLLYKVFAYLLLGRLEHVLDAQQPEEQHGFRAGRRLEEHLLYNFSSTIFLRQSKDDTAAVFAAVQNHSQAGVGVEGWEVLRTKGESKLGMQLLKHHFSTPIKRWHSCSFCSSSKPLPGWCGCGGLGGLEDKRWVEVRNATSQAPFFYANQKMTQLQFLQQFKTTLPILPVLSWDSSSLGV